MTGWRFVPFAERDDDAQTSRTSWLQLDGNETTLAALAAYLADYYTDLTSIDFELDLETALIEDHVDVLVSYGGEGLHRKVTGYLALPGLADRAPYEVFDAGGIRHCFDGEDSSCPLTE
ncbi:hypothetical protein F5X71_34750 [Nocardia brasiliensis]|uniref:Uncharacterized protein n=1 Tax=Nocardia brasiliensis TaxID=37326 RepID=A0A6G9Y0Z1_NOCBR|nr:hypothetical protein [Nocardia brasiliensis]QIS06786.1 hypothetical protein F5X71_34750 [Nocardia brasiliensis]